MRLFCLYPESNDCNSLFLDIKLHLPPFFFIFSFNLGTVHTFSLGRSLMFVFLLDTSHFAPLYLFKIWICKTLFKYKWVVQTWVLHRPSLFPLSMCVLCVQVCGASGQTWVYFTRVQIVFETVFHFFLALANLARQIGQQSLQIHPSTWDCEHILPHSTFELAAWNWNQVLRLVQQILYWGRDPIASWFLF